MPRPFALTLTPAQTTELLSLRDYDPTPSVRERAAAMIKVAVGQSLRAVGRSGRIARRRSPPGSGAPWPTGRRGFGFAPGAAASRRFPPLSITVARQAAQAAQAVVRRAPQRHGRDHSRWTLADLGQVIPWLPGMARGRIHRLLHRLAIGDKRGRSDLPSPDPADDAKLAAITAAQLLAHAHPGAVVLVVLVVLLDEDAFTSCRRPSVSRAWAPRAQDAPRGCAGPRRQHAPPDRRLP